MTSISYVLGPHLYNQRKESRFSGLSDKYTGVLRDSLIGDGASVHVHYDTNEDIELQWRHLPEPGKNVSARISFLSILTLDG